MWVKGRVFMRWPSGMMPGDVLEGLEEQPLVSNPKVRELKKKRAKLLSELRNYKVKFADEVLQQRQNKVDRDNQVQGNIAPG